MNRAVELLAQKTREDPGRRPRVRPRNPCAIWANTPEAGGRSMSMEGRYGPYVKWDKVNATLRRT